MLGGIQFMQTRGQRTTVFLNLLYCCLHVSRRYFLLYFKLTLVCFFCLKLEERVDNSKYCIIRDNSTDSLICNIIYQSPHVKFQKK